MSVPRRCQLVRLPRGSRYYQPARDPTEKPVLVEKPTACTSSCPSSAYARLRSTWASTASWRSDCKLLLAAAEDLLADTNSSDNHGHRQPRSRLPPSGRVLLPSGPRSSPTKRPLPSMPTAKTQTFRMDQQRQPIARGPRRTSSVARNWSWITPCCETPMS